MTSKPTTKKRFKLLGNQHGFTIIEMIAVAVVVGIGIVAIYETFIAANTLSRQSSEYLAASKFAQQELDYYRTQLFTTDVTATSETDTASLLSNSTDVSSSMPGLPGASINCTQASSGNNGKYACATIAVVETGEYHVTIFVGYREGLRAQKTVVLSTYVAQNGVGTNPTVWDYYFNASDDSGGGPYNANGGTVVWSNPANGFDGKTSTSATASTQTTCVATGNCMDVGGTNAPSSPTTGITTVKARIYGNNTTAYVCPSSTMTSPTMSCSLNSPLGTLTATAGGSAGWSVSWTTLSAPSGGWTWAKVHHLVTTVDHCSAVGSCSVSEIQLRVIQ